MELLDIIIIALSIVLVLLLILLLFSFIIYKVKGKDSYLLLRDNSDSLLFGQKEYLHEVVKPRKPQLYKVVNENTELITVKATDSKIKINDRFVVYNFSGKDFNSPKRRKRFTSWSE
ncbi:MAG: hypothetical protein IPM56_11745 [Ignavibacteriales bacterium]|nr:MAG: hypothetical protein IPM56_11745 [Ignavibacteriales bacterium]